MTTATTQTLPNGWTLVTYDTEQISIDPAGLLMFPRHCTPEEAPNYIAAITAAAALATTIRDNNTKLAAANTATGHTNPPAVIVTEGPPPPGATPLTPQATIGRQKNRQRGNR